MLLWHSALCKQISGTSRAVQSLLLAATPLLGALQVLHHLHHVLTPSIPNGGESHAHVASLPQVCHVSEAPESRTRSVWLGSYLDTHIYMCIYTYVCMYIFSVLIVVFAEDVVEPSPNCDDPLWSLIYP